MSIKTLFGLLALTCGSVYSAAQQSQPAPYTSSGIPVGRTAFEAFEKAQLHLNEAIPGAPTTGIRIATYNVHFHENMHRTRCNTPSVLADLKAMDAAVVLFQEVLITGAARAAFDAGLQALGYTHRFFGHGTGAHLGNMIASKYPLHNPANTLLTNTRNLVEAELKLVGNQSVMLLCTHLENDDKVSQLEQSKIITAHIQAKGHTNYVLGADFNAKYPSPPIQNLVKNGPMASSFKVLGWSYPKYTCWAGPAIDFLLVSPPVQKSVRGSYMYHTISSDHLPILMDMALTVDPRATSSFSTAAGTTLDGNSKAGSSNCGLYSVLALVLVFILGGAALFLVIRRRQTASMAPA